MIIKGKIRCPHVYADGTESVEINFSKDLFDLLPVKKNQRAKLRLDVNGKIYTAGIRHTDNNQYIWISPDCEDEGNTVRLSDIIFNAGFKKNDDILISFSESTARVIIENNSNLNFFLPDEINDPHRYPEGSVKRVSINAYERNPKARKKCIEHYGTSCMICKFNFGEFYGPDAEGYIHVHHIKPLAEVNEEYQVDPIEDLRPLCPNCHAYIHMGRECRDLEDVPSLIKKITLRS